MVNIGILMDLEDLKTSNRTPHMKNYSLSKAKALLYTVAVTQHIAFASRRCQASRQ